MSRSPILPALILLTAPALAIDPVNQGTLTLVEGEEGFNTLSIKLSVPFIGNQTQPSKISGTALAHSNLDLASDQTDELTLSDGDIQTEPVAFSISGLFGSVNVDSDNEPLGGTIFTTTPPGPVTPSTGEFDAALHEFLINQGTLSGTALGGPVDIDLAASPFSGTGNGTGTVTLDRLPDSPTRANYDLTAIVPLSFVSQVPTGFELFGSEIVATVTVTGIIKATGQISPPLPYPDWAIAQGIPGAPPEIDSNANGVQNGIIWALGLGLDDNPLPHLLTPNPAAPKGFLLPLPLGGSSGALTIEASPDLSPGSWLPIAPGELSSSANPLPPGTTGNVTIAPGAAPQRYLRLTTNP